MVGGTAGEVNAQGRFVPDQHFRWSWQAVEGIRETAVDYLSNTGKMEWSAGVRIEQNGRVGTAERGECIASEGKFVLSGGQPAIADASGNRTTGHEPTFYLANDSIVVDSGTKPQTQITPH
jgi:hypothetical protein